MENSASVVCERNGAVRLGVSMEIPGSNAEVWEVVGDLPRFACIDPFHRRLAVFGPRLEPGVEIGLLHGLVGVSFWRYGRLLSWDEGRGYSFSDLARRDGGGLFPHVFFIRLEPCSPDRPGCTVLSIRVRGRWRPEWVPIPLRKLWLTLVAQSHAWLLRREFRKIFPMRHS